MRRKDIVENPFTKFRQGIAKGYQTTQKDKGVLGPDSFQRGLKAFFTDTGKDDEEKPTPKAGGKGTEKLKTTKTKPQKQTSNAPLDIKKPIPKLAGFTDGRVKYEYNPKIGQWIGSNGKRLSSQDGVKAYNKVDKSKREYVIESGLKDKTMNKAIKEGLADLAGRAEADHEVQMARADLYKIAKYAIKLHDMLKDVSEERGMEGWQQAKITKAADYIGSVYHNLDYDMKFGDQTDEIGPDAEMQMGESRDTHCSDKCCGADVKREDCKCAPTCKHCNCNATNIDETIDMYKESIAKRLAEKLGK